MEERTFEELGTHLVGNKMTLMRIENFVIKN